MSRKIYPAPYKKNIAVMDTTDGLLQEIVDLISIDIIGLRGQLNRGIPLKIEQSRILQGHAKVLLDINKDTRESQKSIDVSKWTDEELLSALQSSIESKKHISGKTDKNE